LIAKAAWFTFPADGGRDTMTPKDWIELTKALVPLAWPLLAAVALWRLFPILRLSLTRGQVALEVAGFKVSVQQLAGKLSDQVSDLQEQVVSLKDGQAADPPRTIVPAAHSLVSTSGRILWVDDNPENNALEVEQLRRRYVDVVLCRSTDEALMTVETLDDVDAIVSDMGRREHGVFQRDAGLALLERLRRAGNKTPFLLYTTAEQAARSDARARQAGGDGATSSTVELLRWLTARLRNQPMPS
jgi:CheY-like chemotaxis protein